MRAHQATSLSRASQIEMLERRVLLAADPPTNLSATPVYFEDTTLSWVAPSSGAPDQYRIYVSDDNQAFSFLDAEPGIVTSHLHHDDLTGAGQRRYYRVTAVKNSEESIPTASVFPMTAQDQIVLLHADVSSVSEGELTLNWESNPRFTSFAVYSHNGGAGTWQLRDTLTGTSWTDTDDIEEGETVEYRVNVLTGTGAPAYGYILAGANLPLTESRGTTLLVVDETKAAALAPQLVQLRRDLIADGWEVDQLTVDRDDGSYSTRHQAAEVKDMLVEYYGDHPDLKSIIIIGHVPVPFSGSVAVDGHYASGDNHSGAWASDLYYADMDGVWTDTTVDTDEYVIPPSQPENRNVPGDGKWDQDTVPSGIEVSVGRIDFARARLQGNPEEAGFEDQIPGGTSMSDAELETYLLARYLDRNHAFRIGTITTSQQALIDDGFGLYVAWEAGSDPWRNASTIVGSENTTGADWLTHLDASQPAGGEDYLLAFGGGSGIRAWPNGAWKVTWQNNNGYAQYQPEADFRGVFNFIFGSWFMDFDQPQNVLSATLATNGKALVVMPGGRPGLPLHRVALGAPIGDILRAIADEDTFASYESSYDFEQDPEALFVNRHVAIQGDPTLHFQLVTPVENVEARVFANESRVISWDAPAGETGIIGYRVYRAEKMDDPFEPIHEGIWASGTTMTDPDPIAGNAFYMVRAIKLEQTPSGTYQNASTGVFAQLSSADFTSKAFDPMGTQQKIVVQFDRSVVGQSAPDSPLTASDLLVTKVGDESFTTTPAMSWNSGTNTATFTFSSILPDGNYPRSFQQRM